MPDKDRFFGSAIAVLDATIKAIAAAMQSGFFIAPRSTILGRVLIKFAECHVRFTPESGHVQCNSRCLLWAKSGHCPLHSIISSARARNEGDKLSPSAFAVLTLITNMNFDDTPTGRSLGLVTRRNFVLRGERDQASTYDLKKSCCPIQNCTDLLLHHGGKYVVQLAFGSNTKDYQWLPQRFCC